MWLPTPIYERLPQFWLLLGLLFMSSGTYIGFDYSLSFVYFGVGFACCAGSLGVFSLRLRNRNEAEPETSDESTASGPLQAEDTAHGAEPGA